MDTLPALVSRRIRRRLLVWDPEERLSIGQALAHPALRSGVVRALPALLLAHVPLPPGLPPLTRDEEAAVTEAVADALSNGDGRGYWLSAPTTLDWTDDHVRALRACDPDLMVADAWDEAQPGAAHADDGAAEQRADRDANGAQPCPAPAGVPWPDAGWRQPDAPCPTPLVAADSLRGLPSDPFGMDAAVPVASVGAGGPDVLPDDPFGMDVDAPAAAQPQPDALRAPSVIALGACLHPVQQGGLCTIPEEPRGPDSTTRAARPSQPDTPRTMSTASPPASSTVGAQPPEQRAASTIPAHVPTVTAPEPTGPDSTQAALQAQAVQLLDAARQVLEDAKREAANLLAQARHEAAAQLNAAQDEAAHIISTAEEEAVSLRATLASPPVLPLAAVLPLLLLCARTAQPRRRLPQHLRPRCALVDGPEGGAPPPDPAEVPATGSTQPLDDPEAHPSNGSVGVTTSITATTTTITGPPSSGILDTTGSELTSISRAEGEDACAPDAPASSDGSAKPAPAVCVVVVEAPTIVAKPLLEETHTVAMTQGPSTLIPTSTTPVNPSTAALAADPTGNVTTEQPGEARRRRHRGGRKHRRNGGKQHQQDAAAAAAPVVATAATAAPAAEARPERAHPWWLRRRQQKKLGKGQSGQQ